MKELLNAKIFKSFTITILLMLTIFAGVLYLKNTSMINTTWYVILIFANIILTPLPLLKTIFVHNKIKSKWKIFIVTFLLMMVIFAGIAYLKNNSMINTTVYVVLVLANLMLTPIVLSKTIFKTTSNSTTTD
ncbi:MAG: hypothetical protein Q3988_06315 [Gemella sp.]|nr:hypothetical protein [Gemella sp.]